MPRQFACGENLACPTGYCCGASGFCGPVATTECLAPDAGRSDAGALDAGAPDAGAPDSGVADAGEMLDTLCLRPLSEKRRHRVKYGGLIWEVDEFYGDNDGLIIAEVELENARQAFDNPPWAGAEVTDDPRYYNANLVGNPYTKWKT